MLGHLGLEHVVKDTVGEESWNLHKSKIFHFHDLQLTKSANRRTSFSLRAQISYREGRHWRWQAWSGSEIFVSARSHNLGVQILKESDDPVLDNADWIKFRCRDHHEDCRFFCVLRCNYRLECSKIRENVFLACRWHAAMYVWSLRMSQP